jgi:hypothetical protein
MLGATQGQAAGAVPPPSSQTTAIALGGTATLVFGNGVTANVRQVGGNTTGSTVIPVNRDGTPLGLLPEFKGSLNAMVWLWKDHTSHEEAAEITGLGAPVDVPVTWTVDKPELATIDGSTIKAVAAGTVVVKATAGSVTSEQPIAIRAPVRAVRLFCLDPFVVSSAERGTAPTAPLLACHLKNGLPTRIDVEVLVGDTPSDGEEVEWSASDTRVAVVTAGEVRGMAPGLTLVRATVDGVTPCGDSSSSSRGGAPARGSRSASLEEPSEPRS